MSERNVKTSFAKTLVVGDMVWLHLVSGRELEGAVKNRTEEYVQLQTERDGLVHVRVDAICYWSQPRGRR